MHSEWCLQSVREHTFWITRVPATISEVTDLENADLEFTPGKDERYSWFECPADYAGIKQKWVVYHSALMQERQEKTFDNNLEKDIGKARKSVKKNSSPEYACEPDARAAAERWLKKNPRYRFRDCEIMPVKRKLGKCRCRPKSDELLEISYHLSASVVFNDDAVANERRKLGRFVLATNDLELSPDTLLMYYKGQSAVERRFRFLKDKSFLVAEIFLKKNSRIQALAMIMVLCRFIYSMTEFRLRHELVNSDKTVISQTKKSTHRPSLKWIFFLFRRVREYSTIRNGNNTVKIANLSEDLKNILVLLGKPYENYYF